MSCLIFIHLSQTTQSTVKHRPVPLTTAMGSLSREGRKELLCLKAVCLSYLNSQTHSTGKHEYAMSGFTLHNYSLLNFENNYIMSLFGNASDCNYERIGSSVLCNSHANRVLLVRPNASYPWQYSDRQLKLQTSDKEKTLTV